mgnify:CR=1 FL=1
MQKLPSGECSCIQMYQLINGNKLYSPENRNVIKYVFYWSMILWVSGSILLSHHTIPFLSLISLVISIVSLILRVSGSILLSHHTIPFLSMKTTKKLINCGFEPVASFNSISRMSLTTAPQLAS